MPRMGVYLWIGEVSASGSRRCLSLGLGGVCIWVWEWRLLLGGCLPVDLGQCLPLGPGVSASGSWSRACFCFWEGVFASGSRGCLPLGHGVVPASASGRGCLPLGPGGVCLWVTESCLLLLLGGDVCLLD